MPLTLVHSAGDPAANSYVSLTEANTYFDARLYSTAWTGAVDDDERRRALITATRNLEPLPWDGYRSTLTQRLQWPRSGCTDADGYGIAFDAIPEAVRNACCEEAIDLLSKGSDPGAVDPLANFLSLKVGPIAVSRSETAPRTTSERRAIVWDLLAPFLASPTAFDRG